MIFQSVVVGFRGHPILCWTGTSWTNFHDCRIDQLTWCWLSTGLSGDWYCRLLCKPRWSHPPPDSGTSCDVTRLLLRTARNGGHTRNFSCIGFRARNKLTLVGMIFRLIIECPLTPIVCGGGGGFRSSLSTIKRERNLPRKELHMLRALSRSSWVRRCLNPLT